MGIEKFDIYRGHTVANDAYKVKSFRYNGRFKTPKNNPNWIGSEPVFKPTVDKYCLTADGIFSKEYKTVFGPCFHSNSTTYTCDNEGLRGAVRRLTCVREPDAVGVHEELFRNQYNMGFLNAELDHWVDSFRHKMRAILSDKSGDREDYRSQWTRAAHPKKELRVKAERDILYHGFGGSKKRPRVKKVVYKCKSGEVLAKGKYLRAVGDLTCPGSTACGYYMDWVKEAFSETHASMHSHRARAEFIKAPTKDMLTKCFTNLINPQGLYFSYFSDDSCLGATCVDGTLMCNMDISACDGSNYDPVFNLLKKGMDVDPRFSEDIEMAFAQCKLPCKITSDDYKESVTLNPKFYTLYSGSVLTTSINNMANTLIFLAVSKRYSPLMTKAELIRVIAESAKSVGYLLKVQVCEKVEQIQFLKHSPFLDDQGEVGYFLNLGTMFRGLGTCQGDLPGRAKVPLQERAALFTSEVVRSFVHAGDSVITEALRRFIVDKRIKMKGGDSVWSKGDGPPPKPVPVRAFADRYGITTSQIEELVLMIGQSGYGTVCGCKQLDTIFALDYGY